MTVLPPQPLRIWITGASGGVGRALALHAAGHGARLVLTARDAGALEQVARECATHGAPETLVLPLDLSDPEPDKAFVAARDQVRDWSNGEGVDWLVNNAGQGQRGTALETGDAVSRRIFAVNFHGPVALTRLVAADMATRGRGRVAAVTSLLAKFGAPRRSSYAASKHALHGWFDSLREELRGTGVGVTLLVPGWIRTGISQHAWEGDGAAHRMEDAGQARGLSPEEAAGRMFRALASGREEQLIGGWECLSVYGRRYCPGLTRWFLRRWGIG